MHWRIEVKHRTGVFDAVGESVQHDITDLGISSISRVDVAHVYHITGNMSREQVVRISKELLQDPITQDVSYSPSQSTRPKDNEHIIEIAYHPGVMDPVEESTMKGIRDLGIDATSVRTARKYTLHGTLSKEQTNLIVNKVLANKLIQHVVTTEEAPVKPSRLSQVRLITVDLMKATDQQLKKLSAQGQLFLNLNEMKAIQKYFKSIGRNPTDCELETIAQTWSEHCYHKTFRGKIEYTSYERGKKKTTIIRSLLKSTIVKATQDVNKPWCVSVFHDNAGVIAFDKEDCVCFKVETHNHPSALEPFGGANTGLGGVIRDILGTGLGAKPICSTDIFCFAPPDTPAKDLPPGTLHPKRVMKGVVSGVRDYGNKMGIPTVNGAILFDPQFVGNPLVYCGNVGIMPRNKVKKNPRKGDCVVVLGGRTGRDGIHGATFSSGELTTESETVSSGAVQIGNPIQEKKVRDALLIARDEDLYTAITDCGAGGLSSAVGEMGEHLGAKVQLENVPLKYDGLTYTETWISESQERMVMSVPPRHVKRLLEICQNENVEATVIGEFTGTGRLELFYERVQVCDLDMAFLHAGPPQVSKKGVWKQKKHPAPSVAVQTDLNAALLDVLSHYNVCSKEWVIRQYDHEVQAGTVIKPLVGASCDGPSDASVVIPKFGSKKAIALSNGINPRYGMIDPFWMAASCIDEALRQIVAVGGSLEKIAILDNFCWGNPDKPDRLGGLVRCALGCYKAAVGFGVPFISGKDSLYNEYAEGKKSIAIPGTILISAIGIVDDYAKTVTMDFKAPGNLIYGVGETCEEMGGSVYWDTLGYVGNTVPQVQFNKAKKVFQSLHGAIQKGYVAAAHDCSEGGLAVALAEMAFSGGFGATVRLDELPVADKIKRPDVLLFSESNSRFIVEVPPRFAKQFEASMKGVAFGQIGRVESSPEFVIYGRNSEINVNLYIQDLKEAWQQPLRW